MLIAVAQVNFTVGDIAGNVKKITALHSQAAAAKADLIVFSEMAITGYPPEDLVLRKGFCKAAMQAVADIAKFTKKGPAIIAGGLWREKDAVYNSVFLLDKGKLVRRQYKHNLPNYGVFDEKRTFAMGPIADPVKWRGKKLGLLICEDMWAAEVAKSLKKKGVELLVVINASPYEVDKQGARLVNARARVKETKLPLVYVNQVGGQDEVVFDGNSFVLSAKGELVKHLSGFDEDFAVLKFEKNSVTPAEVVGLDKIPAYAGMKKTAQQEDKKLADIYHAMMLGVRDYVQKNRFPGVVLGLSGGIDSAITAAVAVDALGADMVHTVMMPSPYTSKESLEDAAACAKMLGVTLDTIPIVDSMRAVNETLAPLFKGTKPDTTEENIQSRLRGNLLMAVSNKRGKLVLTTGNKSEMAVGYATLYGDMCGGFNVLKDIYKTTVYELSHWRNRQGRVIPERIITKAPSAELKHNQTDQDSLPPYDELDAILECLIEKQLSVVDVVAKGHDKKTVERVANLFYRAEYKRRQAPPGVKITSMSFGRDRRYPLTNGWIA